MLQIIGEVTASVAKCSGFAKDSGVSIKSSQYAALYADAIY